MLITQNFDDLFIPEPSEWKIRENILDDKKNDTVSYTLRNRFHFRKDLSGQLTGEEMIIVPNIIMVGTLSVIKKDREVNPNKSLKEKIWVKRIFIEISVFIPKGHVTVRDQGNAGNFPRIKVTFHES